MIRSLFGVFGFFGIVAVFLISFWTQRSFDWILHVMGSQNEMPYWLAVIATLVFNAVAFAFNILIEIIRLIY